MTDAAPAPALRRVLTLGPLILYGLGVIVGAGIYVAIGAVIGRAGPAAPVSFLLAGLAAAMTGLCYAELGSRFPEAAGCVSYVRHGFGREWLSRLTGLTMTVAVAVAAASIARGTAQYLVVLVALPEPVLTAGVILGFCGVAAAGVQTSVGLAAAMGAIEIAGLVVATIVGLATAPSYHLDGMVPADPAAWAGVLSGAFLAFFAFLGFETLANLAEEVKQPRRTMPLGILGAVAASLVLYLAVVTAVVLSDTAGRHPLLALFPAGGATAFAAVGGMAVANGVLVQIVMLARLFYGMARRGQLPARLARVHPRAGTPVPATLAASAIILVTALAVPFEHLLVLANLITLGVFVLVDLSLWRVHRTHPPAAEAVFTAPRWAPPVAALMAAGLMAAEFL